MKGFKLGTPALVCRWRLAGKRVPMENRHLRALSDRYVNGARVSPELVAWAKQHIEWTLADGAVREPDGVLMIVVDKDGQAAMSVGPYVQLDATNTVALRKRAAQAHEEALETGVAPETLWCARDGKLGVAVSTKEELSGAATLVVDLAHVRHMEVGFMGDVFGEAEAGGVFLVSDEHGIVPASDHPSDLGSRLSADYDRLLETTRLSKP